MGEKGGSGKEKVKKIVRNQAYEAIKAMIINGQLHAGQVTSVQELIDKVNMGRSPVRDAVLKLHDENLLKVIPRKGIFICGLLSKDIKELSELRLAIELFAVDKAVEMRQDDHFIHTLEDIVSRQEQYAGTGNEEAFFIEDERFHITIINTLRNERMNNILADNRRQLIAYGFKALTSHSNAQESAEEHKQILAAIKKGDNQEAREQLVKHLTRTKNLVLL